MSIFRMLKATERINRGHRPVAEPETSSSPPPAPPVGTSYRVGTAASGGPLPVEAQIFLRVMGEDLSAARDLLRDMPPLDRAILLFYTEQVAGLVYEAEGLD